MANVKTATVQNQVQAPAPVAAEPSLAAKVQDVQAQRNAVLESITFSEAFAAAARAARWNDVLNAADRFAQAIKDGGAQYDGAKPTEIARKVAKIVPTVAMELRFALASYSLSGRQANATQLAELSGKLPQLATKGALRDRAVTFGGIVLPPIAGEL